MRFYLSALLLIWIAASTAAAEKEDKTATQIKTVEKLIRAKDYDSAMLIVEGILKEDENHGAGLFQKAVVLEGQKKNEEAIEAYDHAIEVLVVAEATTETRKQIEKCKRAILKLDQSRRILLRHADELEREAKKFKSRDEFAYKKLTEAAEMLRGVWETKQKKEAKGGKHKERITENVNSVFAALIGGDINKSMALIDPEMRKGGGEIILRGAFTQLSVMMKAWGIKTSDIKVKEITMGASGEDAKVIPHHKEHGGWKNMDAQYWVLREKKWYLGDEKKLGSFKPEKKK